MAGEREERGPGPSDPVQGDGGAGLVELRGLVGVEDVQGGQDVAHGRGGPARQGDLRDDRGQPLGPEHGEHAGERQSAPPGVRQAGLVAQDRNRRRVAPA
nr:hypothetical protein GCM10020093_060370 [Planobispora longispora]